MADIPQNLKEYLESRMTTLKNEAESQITALKKEAQDAKDKAEEEREASRKRERDMQDQLDAMAGELARAKSANLTLCQEPANMPQILRDQFLFCREVRKNQEVMNNTMAKMIGDESEDFKILDTTAERNTKMLDLRLAAMHAAMQVPCKQKMEFVSEYYRLLFPKISATSGKYAPGGEKSISEVQLKEALEISKRYEALEPSGGRGGRGGFGGFGEGRGGRSGRGRGRGRGAAAAGAAANGEK